MAETGLAVLHEVLVERRTELEAVAGELAGRLADGRKIMLCGNGGSAADAQHFAAELVNRFLLDRRPYAALALTTDASVLTSVANDYGYEQVFAKQVRGLGAAGDVLVAISTSGNAANVCAAVEAAREIGCHTVAMTGGTGGRLAGLAEAVLTVGCTAETPRIQEGHGLMIHVLCQRIEEILQA